MSDIICVMGPTASGKSKLAVQLAKKLGSEIVSVDSAMVYRGMDIGTAKPTLEEREGIIHHLIDIKDPSEIYSAAQFRNDALTLTKQFQTHHQVSLLVGGTMLYFRALQYGLSHLPSADPEVRESITKEASVVGWMEMHRRLKILDPQAASRIAPTDPQRIQRALEIYQLTGKPMTALWALEKTEALSSPVLNVVVMPADRSVLHNHIRERFLNMLSGGLIEEVEQLMKREDLHPDLPSIRAVGYRQVWEYLKGDFKYAEMVERGIAATRQLAKRQLTWLRSWKVSDWFDSEDSHLCEKVFKRLMKT